MPRVHHERVTISGQTSAGAAKDCLVDADGHLQVDLALAKAEDSAHATGDAGIMSLAVRQDTQADFGADGDYVPLSINENGELRVTTASGGGGSTTISSIAVGTNRIGMVGVKANEAADGSGTERHLVCDTAGHLQVDVQNLAAAINANRVDVNIANGLSTLESTVKAEDTAHAAGDAGVMSLAVRSDELAALAGTTGDYSALQVNERGALYIAHDSPRVSTIMNAQSVSSGTAGLLSSALKVIGRPKTISFEVSNGSLTGTNFEVKLQVCDTLSGTYRWLGSTLYQYSTAYDTADPSVEQKEKFITVKDLIWPYFKVWVKQTSGGAVSFTVKACQ